MMAKATHFSIGIDISKKSMDVALCPADFPSERWMDLPATKIPHAPDSPQALQAIIDWIGQMMPPGAVATHMVVEATGQHG